MFLESMLGNLLMWDVGRHCCMYVISHVARRGVVGYGWASVSDLHEGKYGWVHAKCLQDNSVGVEVICYRHSVQHIVCLICTRVNG
jgi:hypothetical protein